MPTLDANSPLAGTLHAFVAFDWGEEVDLAHARRLLPADHEALVRRRRTPGSIAFRPGPLRYPLGAVRVELPEIGVIDAVAEALVFDFGGVSVSLQIPFVGSPAALSRLAGNLSDPYGVVEAARGACASLFTTLKPAIQQAEWSKQGEDFFVFQFPPGDLLPDPAELLAKQAGWLASLVRLEPAPLSEEEITAALAARIAYSPLDMLIVDWSAAVLIDRDCEETLQTIEFANLQLLEYRYIDDLLDERLAQAYVTIHSTLRSWLPFWRTQARPLRRLGELRLDVNTLFQRTSNALKMVGDQYLSRVYRMVGARFHLADWEQSIRNSLDVVERAYQVVSDQSATFRIEVLEIIIVLLILVEIIMSLTRH